MTITCGQCKHFMRDTVGFGMGIGQCRLYQDYLANKPSEAAKDKAFKAMGGLVHWPDVPRRCSKFESSKFESSK